MLIQPGTDGTALTIIFQYFYIGGAEDIHQILYEEGLDSIVQRSREPALRPNHAPLVQVVDDILSILHNELDVRHDVQDAFQVCHRRRVEQHHAAFVLVGHPFFQKPGLVFLGAEDTVEVKKDDSHSHYALKIALLLPFSFAPVAFAAFFR